MQNEADFCYGLAREIRNGLSGQSLALPAVQRSAFQGNHYLALEEWLEAVQEQLGSRYLLLCLDEFERLGQAMREGKVSLAVFDELREFIQHSSMAFLFCGTQTLTELGPDWSSYFINVQPVEMTYLQADEARQLLTNPDPAFEPPYDNAVIEEVLRLTRCQPYLLQLIGGAMVREVNEQGTRWVTPALFEAALERALTEGEIYFTYLWNYDTGATPAEVPAGQRLLHAVAHGQALPDMESAAAQAALRRLVRYHVIEPTAGGGYQCEVPFVARWVRERAVVGG